MLQHRTANRKRKDRTAEAAPPASAHERKARERAAPRTVDELTAQNVASIHRLEAAALAHRRRIDQVADSVARFAGSGLFLALHVVWFATWIGLNVVPGIPHFDPYPFIFLTLVVSLEAIFLAAFILMSQNRAAQIDSRRNELDLQINLLTEQENTRALKTLNAIAKKLGVVVTEDPSSQVLEQATRPDKLVEQIDKAREPDAAGPRPRP